MPSRPPRRGSGGRAGRSGRYRCTSSQAAIGSVCGRLPTAVGKNPGKVTITTAVLRRTRSDYPLAQDPPPRNQKITLCPQGNPHNGGRRLLMTGKGGCGNGPRMADGDRDDSAGYYLRFRVKNSGNLRAELVEVYAAELLKRQADGSFKRQDWFLPMNLRWSHTGQPFLDAISPGMEKHCDLGHILKPNMRAFFPAEENPSLGVGRDATLLSLDLQVQPFTMSHLLPPGPYRLRLPIAAANAKPAA